MAAAAALAAAVEADGYGGDDRLWRRRNEQRAAAAEPMCVFLCLCLALAPTKIWLASCLLLALPPLRVEIIERSAGLFCVLRSAEIASKVHRTPRSATRCPWQHKPIKIPTCSPVCASQCGTHLGLLHAATEDGDGHSPLRPSLSPEGGGTVKEGGAKTMKGGGQEGE